ncbi:hypothetical protein GCM10026983_45350 [Gracilibacillus alcaliphilus]
MYIHKSGYIMIAPYSTKLNIFPYTHHLIINYLFDVCKEIHLKFTKPLQTTLL